MVERREEDVAYVAKLSPFPFDPEGYPKSKGLLPFLDAAGCGPDTKTTCFERDFFLITKIPDGQP